MTLSTSPSLQVKDDTLEKTLTCLSKSFQLMCDSEHKRDLALVQSVVQRATTIDSPKKRHSKQTFCCGEWKIDFVCLFVCLFILAVTPSCNVDPRPITHPYSCSASQYSICGIVPKALPSIGTSLLQLMLFNHR